MTLFPPLYPIPSFSGFKSVSAYVFNTSLFLRSIPTRLEWEGRDSVSVYSLSYFPWVPTS